MKSNLRKTTKKGLAVVSAMVGLSALFAACSSNDDNRVSGGVSEDAGFVADVAGVAQQGPFVRFTGEAHGKARHVAFRKR